MDKLSVETAGYQNCVSVPNGAPPVNAKEYASHFDFVNWDTLAGKQHVLFTDMDEPGRKLEAELARRLGPENCLRVIPPFGCKDANDVLVKHGAVALADLIAKAQPFPISGVYDADQIRDRVVTLYERGFERGVSTGWPSLDDLYTVRLGEMTIITGIPGSGKSNFLDAMLVNIARAKGWRFGLFSPENLPIQRHAASLVEKQTGYPFTTGPTMRLTREELDAAMDWMREHFYWVLPDEDDDYSLTSLLERAKVLVRRYGINGFVVDPWNEVDHTTPQGVTETEHISRALTEIRRFARTHHVHLWVVAHPAKLQKDQSGQYPVPTPYDISGSAHWRNKADNCISIYRKFATDGPEPPVEVHVQKVRFREVGKIGVCDLRYEKPTATYREVYA
jgi:twinkle protein